MFLIEAGADLAASKGQRGDVALKVVPVLMEEQLVVFQAAPALPPAVIGQHVQVACQLNQILSVKTFPTRGSNFQVFLKTKAGAFLYRDIVDGLVY